MDEALKSALLCGNYSLALILATIFMYGQRRVSNSLLHFSRFHYSRKNTCWPYLTLMRRCVLALVVSSFSRRGCWEKPKNPDCHQALQLGSSVVNKPQGVLLGGIDLSSFLGLLVGPREHRGVRQVARLRYETQKCSPTAAAQVPPSRCLNLSASYRKAPERIISDTFY